ncbi:MAG: DUF2332 domain-containing protein [Acidimicrobiia bacterium]
MTDATVRPEHAALSWLWSYFAEHEIGSYSPIYQRITRAVAADDDVLALVAAAPPRGHQPNVLLAAVHFLVLGGLEHELARVYAGESTADPGPLFVDVCLAHRAEILELLATRHTNTNEVGRSAVIGPALTAAAARVGAPIALVDVGCSAGLNLRCDRYRLDYGPHGATGPADAGVEIDCLVTGGVPPIAPRLPEIRARVGIDRDPVDLADDANVQWLLACIWPDTGRLPRALRALAELRRDPPSVVAGDAVDRVGEVLLGLPAHLVPVVTTTWALAYLSKERRPEFHDALTEVSRTRPVAWVSAEGEGVVAAFADVQPPSDSDGAVASLLGLVTYRAGRSDAELLGFVHPHGRWIDWRAPVS